MAAADLNDAVDVLRLSFNGSCHPERRRSRYDPPIGQREI